ncbi:MAG: zinc-binding dehydrogenase, partial [Anaerostipes sp.]|nr:zinc-binding dehydrogenase [Anaerostipes sp.]
VNTRDIADVNKELRKYSEKGFDDVFIFAPNEEMVTYGVKMLAFDGCLNFFSGPADQEFSSRVNFYNIHYNSTHFVGTSGGNTEDMKQSIELIESKTVNVAKIATHILGLDHAVETTKALPELEGSKKIVYTHKKFPLTEVDKFDENSDDEYIRELKSIVERNGNLWSAEAERYFIQNAPEI